MAESTLSLSLDDLKAAIGSYLGYGRGTVFSEPAWTTEQSNNITDVLKSGLSQVYTPPPTEPGGASHNWSFLRPFASITMTSGTRTVALPDDFGGFEGPIYITSPASASRRWELPVTNEGMVRQMVAASPDTTGAPRIAAESVITGTTATEGTRSNLIVWPTPDADYVLSYTYKHLQDALTGSFPYPPGGQEHAELFKASCIAAAELYLDDMPGARFQYFMQRLTASVYVDRKRKGIAFGYNGDRSDGRRDQRVDRITWGEGITYNGTPF